MKQYINADFVLGSGAIVERRFSTKKYVMPDNRRWVTLILFEDILFLRRNQRFWNLELFGKSINGACSNESDALLNANDAHLTNRKRVRRNKNSY